MKMSKTSTMKLEYLLMGVLLLAMIHISVGVLSEVTDRCCNIGQQWFNESRERCSVYPSPVRGIKADDQDGCRSVIEVCCLHAKQDKQCQRGKQNARIRNSCTGLHSQLGNEDARECCHCCLLGKLAHATGIPCDLLLKYGPMCDSTLEECCLAMKEETTTTTTTVAPLLPADGTSGGICDMFPGKLCAHICTNARGNSYRCSCHLGFSLQSDGRSCTQTNIGNRCATNNPCDHRCIDSAGGILCQCFDGFMLQPDGKGCEDLDECRAGTHACTRAQNCQNTIGSYRCEGPAEEPVPDVKCLAGYEYNILLEECEDIDECLEGRHNCRLGFSCTNTDGGFLCAGEESNDGMYQDCRPGYNYNHVTGACEDINECALDQASCLEGQHCENTLGSYSCRRTITCGTGYTLNRDSQHCEDDDECVLGTHYCGPARQCENTEGSFRCVSKTCPQGYRLEYSTGQCKQVICPKGLKPDRGGNCIDINECVERPGVCRSSQECQNTIGSFTCRNLISCGAGFELNAAGNGCDDIDECLTGTHKCNGPHQVCVNRQGSYLCQCPDGYQMNHRLRQCLDIDECNQYDGQVCSHNSLCQNTPGSFRCTCKDGFESDDKGRVCRDRDECKTPNLCHHECRNTWGSYQCTCNDGYQLAEDERTCEDIDECELWSNRGGSLCLGDCENTIGSYSCSCPMGYTMMTDGRTCQDKDECALGTANCYGTDDFCINTRGGYKCENVKCPHGFIKAPSRTNRNKRSTSRDRWTDRYRRKRRRGPGNQIRSIIGKPALIYQSEDTGIVCVKKQCDATDYSCLLNTTNTVQYQMLGLPSLEWVRKPIDILRVQALGSLRFRDIRYMILSGNEGYWFDVVERERNTGSLRLLRPLKGPKVHTVVLQMDSVNEYNLVISSHIANIKIYISRYPF